MRSCVEYYQPHLFQALGKTDLSSFDDAPDSVTPFKIGEWTVDPRMSCICGQGREEYLEPKPMAVLLYLVEHADEVVSNDVLIREVWNDRPMGDNPVYRCIARLRKAFGDDSQNPAYIVTIPKRGYRLIAPVTCKKPPSSSRISEDGRPFVRRGPLSMPLVIVVAAMVVAGLVAAMFGGGGGEAEDRATNLAIAVMPFSGSDDSVTVFTGGGMAREISRQLAESPALRVISYNSTSSLPAETVDVSEITGLLGADYLLTGQLNHSDGNRIQVLARLFNARGEDVWSQAFYTNPSDILGLFGEITRSVAGSLGVPFDPAWVEACAGTRNIAACQKYKLASEHLRTRGEGYKVRTLRLFEEAITLDPGFSAAHAGMASAYLVPGSEFPWPEAVRRAGIATQRALELNEEVSEAHVARAITAMADSRGPCPPICRDLRGYEEAEQAARRALSLSPRASVGHNVLAIALAGQGKLREGFSHLNIALLHDPLSPALNYNIAVHKAYQGDYVGAIGHVRDYIEAHPNAPLIMHEALALIEHYYGNFDRSLNVLETIADSHSGPTSDWLLTENYHNLGLFDRAQDALDQRKHAAYYDTLLALVGQRLFVFTGQLEALDDVSRTLVEYAAETYGPEEWWPRQIHQRLGMNMFLARRYDQAVAHLSRVHGADGALVDGPFPTTEFDSLHALGESLRKQGRSELGNAVIGRSLALIADRESQGYGGLPDLTAAKARAYAMQGKSALAVATMSTAVAEGWRSYRSVNFADDPRWGAVSGEPEFEALLARVRREVAEMQQRVEFRVAHLDQQR